MKVDVDGAIVLLALSDFFGARITNLRRRANVIATIAVITKPTQMILNRGCCQHLNDLMFRILYWVYALLVCIYQYRSKETQLNQQMKRMLFCSDISM